MKTVWKYTLEVQQTSLLTQWQSAYDLYMPHNAEFLFVREQHGVPSMWFLVDPEAPQEERRFIIAGTGRKIDPQIYAILRYLGSFFLDEGHFVGHVFEVRI